MGICLYKEQQSPFGRAKNLSVCQDARRLLRNGTPRFITLFTIHDH